MGFAPLLLVFLVLLLALAGLLLRRAELRVVAEGLQARSEAQERGSHAARLQHPHIDLTRCIGCGTCIAACPEEGVLDLVHGQAAVIHGSRCVGHGRCAEACPVQAIALTLGAVQTRNDLPALTPEFEAVGTPGLFLAGEVTGYALIATAVSHGTAVANTIADRLEQERVAPEDAELLDLVIVGAGPAGIACALGAKERGLRTLVLEQQELGGTVAKYPRRKLVMTTPVALPLVGRLAKDTYTKEELLDLWSKIQGEHDLPIRNGMALESLQQEADGTFAVRAGGESFRSRCVCMAIGRRGTPRKLGVPGEELSKVSYALLDAHAYQGLQLLVVGGGDSAIEAAVGLAEQEGNEVTLSYRKGAFTRLKARNERRLQEAEAEGRIRVVLHSEVVEITPGDVYLQVAPPGGEAETLALPNDEVFVFAGGEPPFALLAAAGVSFDPKDRPAQAPLVERGSGLLPALASAAALAAVALGFVLVRDDYYRMPVALRPDSPHHAWLRPGAGVGLALGLAAVALVVTNLAYLLRRSRLGSWLPGSLKGWMTAHVLTGIVALLCVLVHGGVTFRDSAGGHAGLAMAVLVLTGAVGRYVYAFLPRAANGRELVLDEVRSEVGRLSAELDREGRGFADLVRSELHALVQDVRLRGSVPARILALFRQQGRLRRALARLAGQGIRSGVPRDEVRKVLALVRRAERLTLVASHYEDLRLLLASWRYFHRWVALLMVLLVVLHLVHALRFGNVDWFGLGGRE
ncbi:MAG: NAD(P)-binding domain-containing protein [Planctomycetes bacterium]|nr:NAD(P)-binding domain-containing protein [Planctomycetota bacterium]